MTSRYHPLPGNDPGPQPTSTQWQYQSAQQAQATSGPYTSGMALTLALALQRALLASATARAAARVDTEAPQFRCHVEAIGVDGARTGARLLIDLRTSGQQTPQQVLTGAAWLLTQQLEPYASENIPLATRGLLRQVTAQHIMGDSMIFLRPICELQLSERSNLALADAQIFYIGDLVQLTEVALLRLPCLGRKGLQEIQQALAMQGLALAYSRPSWQPPPGTLLH